MEVRVSVERHVPLPHWLEAEQEALNRPTILLVEDDGDIREMLVTLLQLAGFVAHPCRTAEEGLEQLREQQFDLVLTDYILPHHTGGWLLQQASREGLLDATPALLVTAHPDPAGVEDHEIIFKPFDLDYLVDRVRQRLEAVNGSASKPERPGRRSSGRAGDGGGRGDCPEPIELILYVSAHSPRSARAIENIRKVLSRYKSTRVRLTVCDLSQHSSAGQDSLAFPAVPGKRSPGPRTYILGHVVNHELLVELLDGCDER